MINFLPASMMPPHESFWLCVLEIIVRIFLTMVFLLMLPFTAFLADSGSEAAKMVAAFMFFACFGVVVGVVTRFLPLLGVSVCVFMAYIVLSIIYTTAEIPSDNPVGNGIFVIGLWSALFVSLWYFFWPLISVSTRDGENLQQELIRDYTGNFENGNDV